MAARSELNDKRIPDTNSDTKAEEKLTKRIKPEPADERKEEKIAPAGQTFLAYCETAEAQPFPYQINWLTNIRPLSKPSFRFQSYKSLQLN